MAFVIADRVRETTTTNGVGTVTLLGATTGFQSFSAIGNSNTTYYTIAHQTLNEWEVGIGTYTSSGTTLARTTVISSSNGGSSVTFSAGTKDVFVSPPASTYPAIPTGQAFYGFGAGAFSWTVPANVTSVCVVCIGAGGGGATTYSGSGGGGGGLAYKNNIVVVPGSVCTLTVGLGGDTGDSRQAGGASFFSTPALGTVCQANGGTTSGGSGGNLIAGDGGGNGGSGSFQGGGGAGGYAGNGGSASGGSGSGGGGAAGRYYNLNYGVSGGGGVGPFGQGSSGVSANYAGGGGSGGETANSRDNPYNTYGALMSPGGRYGGGGGAPGNQFTVGYGSNRGADGCIRIIWGAGRSFPSTGTGDM